MKAATFLSAWLLVALPVSAQQIMDDSGSDFSGDIGKEIASALMTEVKDPFSAQIAQLHKSSGSDDIVCGVINLKNGFGNYVGFQPFFFSREAKRIFLQPSSGC